MALLRPHAHRRDGAQAAAAARGGVGAAAGALLSAPSVSGVVSGSSAPARISSRSAAASPLASPRAISSRFASPWLLPVLPITVNCVVSCSLLFASGPSQPFGALHSEPVPSSSQRGTLNSGPNKVPGEMLGTL